MRTKNVKIGQNIMQLPYHHPVRLAEDLATVDILSGGRVELDAGGGGFDSEARNFGLNPKHRHSRTTEGIEIIRRCWTEDVFSYQGRHWQLKDVRVYPKPLQQPHPPIFVTAQNENSMDRAVRLGLNVCGRGGGNQNTLGIRDMWLDWQSRWHAALAKYGRQPGDLKVNTYGTCFVTDDPEREWARHKEALYYTVSYQRHDGARPYLRQYGENMQKPEDMPRWETIFRTPEDCVKHLRETFADSAPDELIVVADKPGIPWEDTRRYMTTFAEKVLPHIRDL